MSWVRNGLGGSKDEEGCTDGCYDSPGWTVWVRLLGLPISVKEMLLEISSPELSLMSERCTAYGTFSRTSKASNILFSLCPLANFFFLEERVSLASQLE